MTSQAFYGRLELIPFLKKHFHVKLTSNGRKEDCTKKKQYLFRLKGKRKKEQKRSPPTGVERIYALPTAQHVGCVTHWAT